MSTFKTLFFVALMSALLSLSACGGGGTNVAEGGIGGTGISTGSISGFGSIIVNDTHFDISGAEIIRDGMNVDASELELGMVVSVQGDFTLGGTDGTAGVVTYVDLVEGPISDISTDGSQITVLSQTVYIDGALTKPASLSVDDVVEVSGFFRADGSIFATYVEHTDDTVFEIKGEVSNVVENVSFNIGSLQVNWAFADNSLDGQFVEAKGVLNSSDELVASEVDVLSKGLELEDADEAELEGLATTACGNGADLPCSFNLGFIRVDVSASTEFEGGGLLADIQPGVRLEVEGRLVNGVIEAQEVEFEDSIELESDVVAPVGGNELILEYGDTDIRVAVDDTTEFDGDDFDGLGDITGSDHVKVRARLAGDTLKAVRIEDANDSGVGADVEIQAPVEVEAGSGITLLGIEFDLALLEAQGLEFFDQDEAPVASALEFLAIVNVGDVVSLNGELDSGGGIVWEEIEIED